MAGALVSALVDANELELAGQVLADAEPLMAALGLDARLDAARARVAHGRTCGVSRAGGTGEGR